MLNPNNADFKGKPFFAPWQKTDAAYDSLLGISLTLNTNDSADVYLARYYRDRSHIEVSFTFGEGRNILTYANAPLTGEIQVIQLTPTENLVAGTITVINTPVTECCFTETLISPMYIHYVSESKPVVEVEIDTDGDPESKNTVEAKNLNLLLNSIDAQIIYVPTSDGLEAQITFNDKPAPVITTPMEDGVISVCGTPIEKDEESGKYVGVLQLPSGFKVGYMPNAEHRFALIYPYADETIQYSDFTFTGIGEINCDVTYSENFPKPLNACFTISTTGNAPFLNPTKVASTPGLGTDKEFENSTG